MNGAMLDAHYEPESEDATAPVLTIAEGIVSMVRGLKENGMPEPYELAVAENLDRATVRSALRAVRRTGVRITLKRRRRIAPPMDTVTVSGVLR